MSITRRVLKHGHARWEARIRRPGGAVTSRRFERLADARQWKAAIAFTDRGEQ